MSEMRWKRAQRHFIILIVVVIVTVVLLELLFLPPVSEQPEFATRQIYITSVCGDGRRLGNLMFNYASLIGIARRYNMTPVLDEQNPLFDIFDLTTTKSTNVENTLGMYHSYEEYGKRASAYDIKTEHFDSPVTSMKLHGYFQSWRYFRNAFDSVRNEFRFKSDIIIAAKQFHKFLISENVANKVVRVGVHVRRGDILEGHYSGYGYTTPDKYYYTNAMHNFKEKYSSVIFIVCSDDLDWSRDNIQGENVIYSNSGSASVDLAILSLCDHVIMSVGSFGWWGAWFANGTTLYYNNWPKPVSMLEYMVTKRDYFMPNWVPLDEHDYMKS